ncbi:MAG: hypothetical protein IJS29_02655 [Selenomonadaceae bacterium]|nr:hypothetical protein [Selenomonadaceae bacterium]
MDIEKEFCETDFSPLSSIKQTLFERLLKERSKKIELYEDDLDFLAAAGNKSMRNEECAMRNDTLKAES